MIEYVNNMNVIEHTKLNGFFVDWPNPPSPETHRKLLNQSAYVWLAIDQETQRVVGFINAISDQVLSAYIPLLEVLPEYKNQGIGSKLVEKMLESLEHLYMIDLVCDDRFNLRKTNAMLKRNYENQRGVKNDQPNI